MLSQLYIKNIAVIEKQTIDFKKGLNVFTGETGAGKTILVCAINSILGKRISKDMIRAGEDEASVSALFEELSGEACQKLRELDFLDEGEDSVLIMRKISADSKNTCQINGKPASLHILKEIGELLVDIHGQHDNASLLKPENHLSYLDSYLSLEDKLADYKEGFAEAVNLKKDLERLKQNDYDKNIKIDMLKYQIAEIEGARLSEGELDSLRERRGIMRNSEKIAELLGQSIAILDGDGEREGVLDGVASLLGYADDVSSYIQEFESIKTRLNDVYYEIEEVGEELRDRLSEMEYDPNELSEIEDRLSLISSLTHKYGEDEAQILSYLDKCRDELDASEFSEEKAERMEEELTKLLYKINDKAEEISKIRLKGAEEFISRLEGELGFLNMPNVKLSIRHEKTKLKNRGIDDLEFLISTNPGESPKPMAKIASGGELSRIMLSVKNVFAEKDKIPTSVFDEIDTGISGLAAQRVGEKLKQLSSARQIICVTHLAQVAMFADNHLLIKKNVDCGKTFTTISSLSGEDRAREIARITSGDVITEASLQSAREMLEVGNKTKSF